LTWCHSSLDSFQPRRYHNSCRFFIEGGILATRSAAKAHRQSIKRRLRNRAVKSATKTAIKRANETIAGGDFDAAREAVRAAISTLDRAARKGVLHPNNAGRHKSRLLLRYNASVAALQTPVAERPARKEKPGAAKAAASKEAKGAAKASAPKTAKGAKSTAAKKPKK
jgi:small subunit ribosomal protein S20